jgi:hypothetical protein
MASELNLATILYFSVFNQIRSTLNIEYVWQRDVFLKTFSCKFRYFVYRCVFQVYYGSYWLIRFVDTE